MPIIKDSKIRREFPGGLMIGELRFCKLHSIAKKKKEKKKELVFCLFVFLFGHTEQLEEYPTRDQTHAPPAAEVQSLNHWAIREFLQGTLFSLFGCTHGLQDLSSPTRDGTCALCSRSLES